jgi:hypothetical protein
VGEMAKLNKTGAFILIGLSLFVYSLPANAVGCGVPFRGEQSGDLKVKWINVDTGSSSSDTGPCYKNPSDNVTDTYAAPEMFEYLKLKANESLDPYWNPAPSSFAEIRYPLEFYPDSTVYREGYIFRSPQHNYEDQWELFEFKNIHQLQQFDTAHTILQTQEGEEGLHTEQLQEIWGNHVKFACNRNLLLLYANLQKVWDGEDKQEWRDQKLIKYFRNYSPEKLEELKKKNVRRKTRMDTINQWVDHKLLRGIDYPRNALQGFPYPKFGDENHYFTATKNPSQWDELAHVIDESIKALKEFRNKLRRRGSEWAMPHQIPYLIKREEWGRVIELSSYRTGPSGGYGGFSTFERVYKISKKSGFKTPPLKTVARFLYELHPSEVPASDTETVQEIRNLVKSGSTKNLRKLRVHDNLAVVDRYREQGGDRIYLLRENGKWKVKGSLAGWIY